MGSSPDSCVEQVFVPITLTSFDALQSVVLNPLYLGNPPFGNSFSHFFRTAECSEIEFYLFISFMESDEDLKFIGLSLSYLIRVGAVGFDGQFCRIGLL